MRIIDTDNFGGDYPDESFIAINIVSKRHAEIMCNALNDDTGPNCSRYYKVVEDDYRLVPGFEP